MKKFLLFTLLVVSNSFFGQNTPDPYKFTSLVDLYEFPAVSATGTMDAQIPLYTIDTRGLELPLALNYDQMGNSNVFYIGNQFGDAWVLSALGTISRECKDRPIPYFSSSPATACGTTYTRETYRNYSLENDEYYYSINPSATSRSKPDIYTFSFLGLTGKFIINKQGSQYVAQLIEASDFVTITIDSPPSGNDYNFESISITDKNGFKYKYANPTNINQNQSNKLTFAKNLGFIPIGCSLDAGSGETPYEGVELVGGDGTRNGDGLISVQIIPGNRRFWENMELTEIYDKDNNLLVSYEYEGTGFANPGAFQWVNGLATLQSYQKLYLKKINIVNQGSITFNNIFNATTANVVGSYTNTIEVKDLKNNLIKKFTFGYLVKGIHNIKYLKDFKDGSYGLSFHKRLLTEVKEYDTASQKFLQTTVAYKNATITNTNTVVDRYGFLTKVGYCFTDQHISKNDYKADAFMLQKIKYPTGGSVIYKFEPNTFSHSLYNTNVKDYNYDNHVYTEIPLNRSGSTATFTANAGDTIAVLNTISTSTLALFKKTSGAEQLVKTGFASKDPQNTLTEEHCKHLYTQVVLPVSDNNQYIFKYSGTGGNTSGLKVYRKTYSGTYYNFRYSEGNRIAKIAYFKDNVSQTILDTPVGEATAEKVISFDYADQSEANTSSGRVRTPAPPQNGGMPSFNVIYDQVTTTISGIGKQYTKYDFPYNSNWSKSIRTDVKESTTYDLSNQTVSQSSHSYVYGGPSLPSGFSFCNLYDDMCVKPFIKKSTVISKNYEGGNFNTTTASTTFDDNHRQITVTEQEDALGKTTKSEFDYTLKGSIWANTQTRNYIDNSLREQLLNTYGTTGDFIRTEFKTPDMSAYEKVGNENNKHINGLLMGYLQPDGTPVTLVYGYLGTQVIAKLVNVDANAFYSGTYQSILNNLDMYSTQYHANYSEANLKTALNSLRTTFPNALVTTYTYKPMVGISSSTDENGKTTTYEYDTFNRLKTVKDSNGKVLKEYTYNFAN